MGTVLSHGSRKRTREPVIAAAEGERASGMVLRDCTVWQGDGSDVPVEAIAIKGDTIFAIGGEALRQPANWPRISLKGRTVLPGLIDSHVHLTTAAKKRLRLSLDDCSSVHDLLETVKKWAAAHRDDEWIVGSGWDDSRWKDRVSLSKRELDTVMADKPVFLVRRDRHSAVLNSLALTRLHWTNAASSALVPRDDTGDVLGIIREGVLDEFSRQLPPVPQERALEALAEEQRHLWALGIVGVHTIERKSGLELLEEFSRRKKLGLRLYVSVDGFSAHEWSAWQGEVRPLGMKWYADGSLGSDTAWMLSPDQRGTTGVAVMQGAALRTVIEEALELGLNPEVHAIGDKAVREVLDIYEPLLPGHPSRLFRIEHVQHIDKADLTRLGHDNLVLSVQPCHLLSDQEAMRRVLRSQNRLDYAYHSMLKHGGVLILGTDLPIEPADPWRNIRAAMARCDKGEKPTDPHECLSWPHVLSAYTRLPAQSAGWHETGQLVPGRKADLIIVHHDPVSELVWEQQVELTMHNGQIVHSTGSIQFPCDWPTL